MADEGWVKLFRKFTEWEWYGDINTKTVFIHLLLIANFEEKRWMGRTIERGQAVIGLFSLSEELGLSIQQVRTALGKLESTGEIVKKATNKFTIVTICKYEQYQQVDNHERQTSNKQITNEQQTNNNNIRIEERKKIKKEDNTLTSVSRLMADEGWVKLFRKFTEWEWYGDINTKTVFIHLLLIANFEEKRWMGRTIERGQAVIGLFSLSEELGLSIQQVRTALGKLESTGEIVKKATNESTIVTICKYEQYQQVDNHERQTSNKQITNEQQTSNKQITNEQQTNNNNIRIEERKKIKKEDNTLTSVSLSDTDNPVDIDLKGVMAYWNSQIATHSSIISPIKNINNKRKISLLARIREYGKEAVKIVIDNAIQSDFLNGKNNKGWKCTFDWIFQHPMNFIKVYENNYGNTEGNQAEHASNGNNGHRWGSQAERVWNILTKPVE